MSNVTVCVRFRPISSKEIGAYGNDVCFTRLDGDSFVLKDERDEDVPFSFDKVFYQDSTQADVYEFLALPIVKDTINGVNGTILTYGQTGAGKTYSMEGLDVLDQDEHKKGLLPRVVDEIFECTKSSSGDTKYTIKLSMVEIYVEKIRDLLDLSKDNLVIKESKDLGIYLTGITEISIRDPQEAMCCISRGIANRAVGETQMNMSSSRSHCIYIISLLQESTLDKRASKGKLMLVDLAGSEKVDKTGAEGKIFEEAKAINKSLSALGNVINALTMGKVHHVPYRDSKLTRVLQDALGGNTRTALLCCCSPSSSNASETLSTLRFGTRTKLIKVPTRAITPESKCTMPQIASHRNGIETRGRRVGELRRRSNAVDFKMLEEMFLLEDAKFKKQPEGESESSCGSAMVRNDSELVGAVVEVIEEHESEFKAEEFNTAMISFIQLASKAFEAAQRSRIRERLCWISLLICCLIWVISLNLLVLARYPSIA